MSEQSGPPSLSLALASVVGASVDNSRRSALLAIVRPDSKDPRIIPFPGPRRPLDDDPDAA
ncbi:MAG: hypothetical protein QG622_1092 [Actinomycetota bacterium]|nr:hypothetical protein [Actinomycetota bacterium]